MTGIIDTVSAVFSFAGAGIGAKAVRAAVDAAAALGAARVATRAFNALDHALPDRAPAVTAAANIWSSRFAGFQSAATAAALWREAVVSVGVAGVIYEGGKLGHESG